MTSDDTPSQTYWSQGILHKGYKYALDGDPKVDLDVYAMQFWHTLKDIGDHKQYLLSWEMSVLADAHSQMPYLAAPARNHKFGTDIQLALFPEVVIDAWGVLKRLRCIARKHIVASMIREIAHRNATISRVLLEGGITIYPKRVFLCAGRNNAMIWKRLMGMKKPVVQQDRKVFVGEFCTQKMLPIQAHIIYKGKWQLTITSQQDAVGRVRCRLGGPIFDQEEQLPDAAAAVAEIIKHFFKFDVAGINSTPVIRAEKYAGGVRVLAPGMLRFGNVTMGWPTKLVMIPELINQMLK
jgi:hypothetical protein